MTTTSSPDISSLIDILEQEALALASGRLDELAGFNIKKEQLTESILERASEINPEALNEVKAMATANLRLIDAAKRGVQNVRKRLEDLNRLSSGTHTYGSDGCRNQWTTDQPKQDISL